ncbi:Ribonuclease III [Rubellimicrobium mesophilum DSM 19309]|uniref:Ribonuclease 3 n=1 Tax=Rubellimicrobium mesophilum DSM 19309 TaxID=442562 RepID=A0A017HW79_9RHOB|nr:ribonuclease III [Rubellimicrobium mesophilum]EYD78004.1 Ribonuclease III [Rubellimicrobium mesophilum DSM 19309]
MKLSGTLRDLSGRLGHEFRDPSLLVRALTHGSRGGEADNQRLEFLGDRVLGLVVAEALLEADPGADEGRIAPRFNALVRRETCAEVARSVDLGAGLKLGRSEMIGGGRKKEALLADAMEAVIAAVYLDGGLEAARAVILGLWQDRIAAAPEDARDAKSALQEWAQARGLTPPDYVLIGREGPDHQPRFVIEARLSTGEAERAEGATKRAAEHAAAAALLGRLE